MGAAAFVLVIACANVANLNVIRGVRREHEMVVRASLGAGTGTLRRLLLVENLVLALLGGGFGLVIAYGGVGMLVDLRRAHQPAGRGDPGRRRGARVHAGAHGRGGGAALVRAQAGARANALGAALASGGKRSTGGVRRQRLQQALVVAQIAVSMALLTGAGLLTRTMQRLTVVDAGLKTDNVLTLEVPADFGREDKTRSSPATSRWRPRSRRCPG